MIYLIQENTFRERNYEQIIHALERLGLEWEECKYIPFVHEVQFKTDRKDVWCFGAYSMTETAVKYGFKPGCMANENHDFEVYGPKYEKHMLNSDAIVLEFTDKLPEGEDEFFIRPTKDTKMFSGAIYSRENWDKYVNTVKENDAIEYVDKIMISSLKNIHQEIRCWVVGGKVITTSQYKLGYRITYQNMDWDEEVTQYAQQMVDIYQPARAFVLDICRTENGFKIVEINCINSAGFYDMNAQKLLIALENEFNYEN